MHQVSNALQALPPPTMLVPGPPRANRELSPDSLAPNEIVTREMLKTRTLSAYALCTNSANSATIAHRRFFIGLLPARVLRMLHRVRAEVEQYTPPSKSNEAGLPPPESRQSVTGTATCQRPFLSSDLDLEPCAARRGAGAGRASVSNVELSSRLWNSRLRD
jgi:hypothetical protein